MLAVCRAFWCRAPKCWIAVDGEHIFTAMAKNTMHLHNLYTCSEEQCPNKTKRRFFLFMLVPFPENAAGFLEKNVVVYTPESIGEMEGQIMYYAVASSFLPCFCVKHEALFFLPFQILEKIWPGRDMAHPVWVYQWLIASSMQGCLGIRLNNNIMLEEVCDSAFFLAPSLLSKRENIRLVCFVI